MAENRFSCPSDAMSRDSAPPVSFHSHKGTASGNCWTETKRGEASGAGATNKMPIVIAGNARMAHSPFFKRMKRILYHRFRGDKFCKIIDLIHYPQVLAGHKERAPDVNCQMACCAMSSVLGAITEPPNGQLVNGSFGNLV